MSRTILDCPDAPDLKADERHPHSITKTYAITVITPIFGGGAEAGRNDPATLIRRNSRLNVNRATTTGSLNTGLKLMLFFPPNRMAMNFAKRDCRFLFLYVGLLLQNSKPCAIKRTNNVARQISPSCLRKSKISVSTSKLRCGHGSILGGSVHERDVAAAHYSARKFSLKHRPSIHRP